MHLPNTKQLAQPTLVMLLVFCGCQGATAPPKEDTTLNADATINLDTVAESYVKLVLAVGQHDADYVDAYYGPKAWQDEATAESQTLASIQSRADILLGQFEPEPLAGDDTLESLRRKYLHRQLGALNARVELLSGTPLTFEAEARALYDATPPRLEEAHFQATLDELDRLLASEGFDSGSLIERLETFRRDFVIPTDKLDVVFREAVDACRERTERHIELPAGENFKIEYVTGKSWSGYNWYQGELQSLIQVNTDLPIFIDRAVDLACHEGYPGHHLYNALLEQHLVRNRGWIEYSVYPLFSPQSLIAEGSANFGIEMAFPGDERLTYERDVLFPLAGLDAKRASAYHQVLALSERLSYAGNEAARRYLDGEIDAQAATEWLTHYAATSPERAAQRITFFDQYRSYVINYNLGQDLVRSYIEAQAGEDPQQRWQVFEQLLSSPRLPSGLR